MGILLDTHIFLWFSESAVELQSREQLPIAVHQKIGWREDRYATERV